MGVVQLGLAALLCVIATVQPLQMEFAKKRSDATSPPFHTPSAVLYTELAKLLVACAIYARQRPTLEYKGTEGFALSRVLTYAVPAALFVLQNNLVYVALQMLDPPVFQLWACFKLIPVGVFSRFLLHKQLSRVQWTALLLLAVGMASTTISCTGERLHGGGSAGWSRKTRGIMILLLNGCLSGLSGVFNEWLIKFQDPKAPLMYKNAMLYTFGALFALPGWQPATFEQFTAPLPVTIVLTNAAAGLTVSFVLKYCDSIVKGFATSVSVLLAMTASSVLFSFELTTSFVLGSIVVCVAFYLYFADFNRILIDYDTQQLDAQQDANSEAFASKSLLEAEPDPEDGHTMAQAAHN